MELDLKELRIGGMDDIVTDLTEAIYRGTCRDSSNITNSSGILVTGTVGSGKTYIVNSILKALPIPSLFIKSASVVQANIGESEKYLHDVFSFADQNSPCVIAFDDIDVLIPSATSVVAMFQMRLSTYFLREIRRRNSIHSGVVFIGITGDNQLGNLNTELRCVGFMDYTIHVPRLDKSRRLAMINTLLPSSLFPDQDDVKSWLCEQTASYSAADLHSLCSTLIHCTTTKEYFSTADNLALSDTPNKLITKDLCKAHLSTTAPSSSRELHPVQPLEGGFSSLFGIGGLIERVRESIIQPLLHPEVYQLYNLQPPSGALFYGLSGTGKSAMVQAIATELKNQVQVIEISCTDILGKYLGESEKKLRDVFNQARLASPCILFLDNIENLAQIRGQDSSEEKTFDRLLSCLLTELDGLYSDRNQNIMVIGSTIDIHHLDSSILRPGRLEEHIQFSIPTPPLRKEILASLLQNIPLQNEEERQSTIDWLCLRMSDMSVAEIRNVVVKAVYCSLKENPDCPLSISRQHLIHSLSNTSDY